MFQIQQIPNTRVLLQTPDGKLAGECCCTTCLGNCCCDPSLPAWFQSPLVVNIKHVVDTYDTSTNSYVDGEELPIVLPNPYKDALRCIVGDWVLPYANEAKGVCVWENTFSPGRYPESAVFSIRAEVAPSTPTQKECLKLTVNFLSCRDCDGLVLTSKPEILFFGNQLTCSSNYGDSQVSVNVNSCGCNDAGQSKLVNGSWNTPYADVPVEILNADMRIGYEGLCWNHPDSFSAGGTLRIDNPRFRDVGGNFVEIASANLSALIQSVHFHKVSHNVSHPTCVWTPDGGYPAFSENVVVLGSDDTPLSSGCAYQTHATGAYLNVNLVEDDGPLVIPGGDITSVEVRPLIEAGCYGYLPDKYNAIATVLYDAEELDLVVRASWIPDSRASCSVGIGLVSPYASCNVAPSYNSDLCDCDYTECGLGDAITPYSAVVYFRSFPYVRTDLISSADFINPADLSWNPQFNGNLVPLNDTLIVDNFCQESPVTGNSETDINSYSYGIVPSTTGATLCPNTDYCSCCLYHTSVPEIIAANDFAPEGARYELIVRAKHPKSKHQVNYSIVYTKRLSDESHQYPRGYWQRDWLPSDSIFQENFDMCVCSETCAGFTAAVTDLFAVSAGRVPTTTLAAGGVSAFSADGKDSMIRVEVVPQRRADSMLDPCCGNTCLSSNPCTHTRCNKCTCFSSASANCQTNLQNVRGTWCCGKDYGPFCYEVKHTEDLLIQRFKCNDPNTGLPVESTLTATYICDESIVASDNPPEGTGYHACNCAETGRSLPCVHTIVVEPADNPCGVLVIVADGICCAIRDCAQNRYTQPIGVVSVQDCIDVDSTETYLQECEGTLNSSSTLTDCDGFTSQELSGFVTVGRVAGCPSYAYVDGSGQSYSSANPACSYNCSRHQVSGKIRTRLGPMNPTDTNATLAKQFRAEVWYFPGNGDAKCANVVGSKSASAAPPYEVTGGSPGFFTYSTYYVYAEFSYSFDIWTCGKLSEPTILLGKTSVDPVGVVVEVLMSGTIKHYNSSSCTSSNCTSPL